MSQTTVGVYVTIVGYNFSVSISSDRTWQLSSMPQLSVGGSAAANVPIITRLPNGEWVIGPDQSTNQPSGWGGIGTPSGLPGPVISIMQELGDGRQVMVQIGGAVLNDFIEAGVSITIPNHVIQEIPNPNGLQTVGVEASVHFDHDANGFAQKSGWLGQGDGLLAANQAHWRQTA